MNDIILQIKKDLRASMNGVASAAMRSSADYRVNFGVELPRLWSIAEEYGKNEALAQELWKESVRECRILATMIQPAETFDSEYADIWIDGIHTAEIAQIAALNLFQYMNGAARKAFQWIASEDDIREITGLSVMFHLIRRSGDDIREQEACRPLFDELHDQLTALLADECSSMQVRQLANNLKNIMMPL